MRSFNTCLLLALALLALAAGSVHAEILTRNWAQSFDAGDQFGAVVVCTNKPAFVGGFREDTTKRYTANVIQSVNLDARSFPTPLTANLSVEIKGGNVLAPGNGRVVYSMAEKQNEIYVFRLNENCTNWDGDSDTLTPKWNPVSFGAAASIGSVAATFAGGQYPNAAKRMTVRGNSIAVTSNGIAVNTTDNAVYGFSLTEARSGLVGVSLPDQAWYAGGMDADLNLFDTVDVVTSLGDNSYDVNGTRFTLSQPRTFAAGAYAQGKVFIAGGVRAINISGDSSNFTFTFSNVVDIFNVATGVRNTTTLPGPARGFLTAVATDEFVYFAAGVTASAYTYPDQDVIFQNTTNVVDIYHIASGTWASRKLTGGARMYASGVAIPDTNVAFFAPGSYYPNGAQRDYTSKVDVLFAAETSAASSTSPMAVIAFIASLFA